MARAVGKEGTLYVVKDLGLQEPYRGSSPIISGEIAEDFTYYFATSEQTPSAVGLGVLVNPDHSILASGGFILQVMPEAEEEAINTLEERLKIIPSVSGMVEKGLTPEEMLKEVVGREVRILHEQPIRFHCGCSYEKSLAALSSLGTEVLKEYVEKGEEPEILCHFCRERYVIPVAKVEEVIKSREWNETS
ncbi:33 kDa chaperonin (fragment 2) [[Clostridium] ultunense Esp]|nr:33 kDa chaperonin (fragment 2) [[Clostridium] ultunense Esp]